MSKRFGIYLATSNINQKDSSQSNRSVARVGNPRRARLCCHWDLTRKSEGFKTSAAWGRGLCVNVSLLLSLNVCFYGKDKEMCVYGKSVCMMIIPSVGPHPDQHTHMPHCHTLSKVGESTMDPCILPFVEFKYVTHWTVRSITLEFFLITFEFKW